MRGSRAGVVGFREIGEVSGAQQRVSELTRQGWGEASKLRLGSM